MAKTKKQPSSPSHPGKIELPQTQPPFDVCLINRSLRSGDLCPQCGQARLDYDGMLNLACPACGFALAGSCT